MMRTSPEKRRGLGMLLALTACATLTGCATMTASGGTECTRWRPIYWSKSDTDDTIRQVKEHNAVFKKLCGRP